MNIDRLKELEKLHKSDPNDPFILYAIAIEWRGTDNTKTLNLFEVLLREHEDYIGTYYHAAQLYSDLGENEKAKATYEKGIRLAKQLGEHHALRELNTAYNEFLFEEDD